MSTRDSELSRRQFVGKASAAVVAAGLSQSDAPSGQAAPASGKKIRMGIVGGGFGASFQWHEQPDCIVEAVSDLRTDRRDRLMKVYKCAKSHESLEKLILDKNIDGVAVFTGAPDHARHVQAVLNAGKHCICAVPAAMTLEECQQLKDTKERTGLKYMMAETSYYRYHTIAARDLFREGKFGTIYYSEVEYYHPRTPGDRARFHIYKGKPTWRYGFPPMHYPTHSTGFLTGVTGERLIQISCLGWVNPGDSFYPDNAYKNPFCAQVGLGKTDRNNMCRCNVIFQVGKAHGERAQWFGTKLAYYMPGSGQPFRVIGDNAPKWKQVPKFFERLPEPMRHDSGHGGSHTFITHEFVRALVEDREPAIDIYESLAMTAPGIVAHQSSLKDGEQLRVPSFDKKS